MIPYGRQLSALAAPVGASARVVNLEGIAAPIAIHLLPAAGNDLRLEVSITPGAAANPAAAHWIDEATTTSSARRRVLLLAPVSAARISRAAGSSADNQYEVRA